MTTIARVRAVFVILALFVLGASPAARQTPGAPADVDAWVTRAMTAFEVPGVSLAVVKDGKVVVAKGYGVRKLGEPTPVDAQTLFGIASNTKVFTATALGLLVEEGKLRWDAPRHRLSAVVPDVRPVRDARDDRARSAGPPQRPRPWRGRSALVAVVHATTARKSRVGFDTSRSRRASAARTRTTTCSTSWPEK